MSKIAEENFIQELLKEIPEFESVHEKEYHKIGINLVFGDLKRLAEKTIQQNDQKLLKRIAKFILRCNNEGDKDVQDAVFVSFFETMNEESIKAISKYLPERLNEEIQEFLRKFDEVTS
ncbi:hypothetical protein HYV81_04370 [Candidatus Woesearchaeota archaeon]|nr:hypothetical protein [Candidatus Woesearchaeota archaeon]